MTVAMALPVGVRAEPAPARAQVAVHEPAATCERQPTCMAEQFAHALASPADAPVVRLDALIAFTPGSLRVYSESREKLQTLAAAWRKQPRWSTITVASGTSRGRGAALAQKRADKIRGYLIRYGVPPGQVVAVGDDAAAAAADRVDLAIEICDPMARDCARLRSADKRR